MQTVFLVCVLLSVSCRPKFRLTSALLIRPGASGRLIRFPAALARVIPDALSRNIEKAGEPAASDFADSGTQDMDAGFTLKVVEPIFKAGVMPRAEAIEAGGDATTLRASRDLAGMRTAWSSLQKQLVYEKEEVKYLRSRRAQTRLAPATYRLTSAGLGLFPIADDCP